MKNKIKIGLIILIILLIITLTLYVISKINSKNNEFNYSNDSALVEENIEIEENNEPLIYENNNNRYFTLISIITRFLDAAQYGETEALVGMLDSNYVSENKINKDNVLDIFGIAMLESESEYYKYNAKDIYTSDLGTVTIHFVYGTYYNIADMEDKELNLMIALDSINQTFYIYGYDYMEKMEFNKLKIGDTPNIQIKTIEDKEYNYFSYLRLSEEELCQNYFNDYKELLVFKTEDAYNKLQNEYSKLKFENFNDFNQYIQDKKIKIYTSSLTQYKVQTSNDGTKTYICKDNNDKIYFFTETDGIMRYTAILDNYVIPNNEFIESYTEMLESEKTVVNIKRFTDSLNDKNYYYAYNCLSDGFKNNYFKTLDSFKDYVTNSWFDGNFDVEYTKFEEESGLYKYTIILKNKDNEEETITKTIIMKLTEGTEFEMSFNV